jgi:hypothetical protein
VRLDTLTRVAKPNWPVAKRLRLPAAYGASKTAKPLLPWSYIVERMTAAQHYWIASVDARGRPHAAPVDGVWLDDRLYFGGDPATKRQRNLARSPHACVHLGTTDDVVIMYGEAPTVTGVDRATATRLAAAASAKYGYGQSADSYATATVSVFRPRVVIAWKSPLKDPTRWELP